MEGRHESVVALDRPGDLPGIDRLIACGTPLFFTEAGHDLGRPGGRQLASVDPPTDAVGQPHGAPKPPGKRAISDRAL
jgi:hypothetical protein